MAADWQLVSVRCRSDYEYAQEPRQVRWPGGEWLDVEAVVAASRRPSGRDFVVEVGAQLVELRYTEAADIWEARPRATVR